MKLPYFPKCSTYYEVQQYVWDCKQQFPLCRVGQVVCNVYTVPQALEKRIYELDSYAPVVLAILDHLFNNLVKTEGTEKC